MAGDAQKTIVVNVEGNTKPLQESIDGVAAQKIEINFDTKHIDAAMKDISGYLTNAKSALDGFNFSKVFGNGTKMVKGTAKEINSMQVNLDKAAERLNGLQKNLFLVTQQIGENDKGEPLYALKVTGDELVSIEKNVEALSGAMAQIGKGLNTEAFTNLQFILDDIRNTMRDIAGIDLAPSADINEKLKAAEKMFEYKKQVTEMVDGKEQTIEKTRLGKLGKIERDFEKSRKYLTRNTASTLAKKAYEQKTLSPEALNNQGKMVVNEGLLKNMERYTQLGGELAALRIKNPFEITDADGVKKTIQNYQQLYDLLMNIKAAGVDKIQSNLDTNAALVKQKEDTPIQQAQKGREEIAKLKRDYNTALKREGPQGGNKGGSVLDDAGVKQFVDSMTEAINKLNDAQQMVTELQTKLSEAIHVDKPLEIPVEPKTDDVGNFVSKIQSGLEGQSVKIGVEVDPNNIKMGGGSSGGNTSDISKDLSKGVMGYVHPVISNEIMSAALPHAVGVEDILDTFDKEAANLLDSKGNTKDWTKQQKEYFATRYQRAKDIYKAFGVDESQLKRQFESKWLLNNDSAKIIGVDNNFMSSKGKNIKNAISGLRLLDQDFNMQELYHAQMYAGDLSQMISHFSEFEDKLSSDEYIDLKEIQNMQLWFQQAMKLAGSRKALDSEMKMAGMNLNSKDLKGYLDSKWYPRNQDIKTLNILKSGILDDKIIDKVRNDFGEVTGYAVTSRKDYTPLFETDLSGKVTKTFTETTEQDTKKDTEQPSKFVTVGYKPDESSSSSFISDIQSSVGDQKIEIGVKPLSSDVSSFISEIQNAVAGQQIDINIGGKLTQDDVLPKDALPKNTIPEWLAEEIKPYNLRPFDLHDKLSDHYMADFSKEKDRFDYRVYAERMKDIYKSFGVDTKHISNLSDIEEKLRDSNYDVTEATKARKIVEGLRMQDTIYSKDDIAYAEQFNLSLDDTIGKLKEYQKNANIMSTNDAQLFYQNALLKGANADIFKNTGLGGLKAQIDKVWLPSQKSIKALNILKSGVLDKQDVSPEVDGSSLVSQIQSSISGQKVEVGFKPLQTDADSFISSIQSSLTGKQIELTIKGIKDESGESKESGGKEGKKSETSTGKSKNVGGRPEDPDKKGKGEGEGRGNAYRGMTKDIFLQNYDLSKYNDVFQDAGLGNFKKLISFGEDGDAVLSFNEGLAETIVRFEDLTEVAGKLKEGNFGLEDFKNSYTQVDQDYVKEAERQEREREKQREAVKKAAEQERKNQIRADLQTSQRIDKSGEDLALKDYETALRMQTQGAKLTDEQANTLSVVQKRLESIGNLDYVGAKDDDLLKYYERYDTASEKIAKEALSKAQKDVAAMGSDQSIAGYDAKVQEIQGHVQELSTAISTIDWVDPKAPQQIGEIVSKLKEAQAELKQMKTDATKQVAQEKAETNRIARETERQNKADQKQAEKEKAEQLKVTQRSEIGKQLEGKSIEGFGDFKGLVTDGKGSSTLTFIDQIGEKVVQTTVKIRDMEAALKAIQGGTFGQYVKDLADTTKNDVVSKTVNPTKEQRDMLKNARSAMVAEYDPYKTLTPVQAGALSGVEAEYQRIIELGHEATAADQAFKAQYESLPSQAMGDYIAQQTNQLNQMYGKTGMTDEYTERLNQIREIINSLNSTTLDPNDEKQKSDLEQLHTLYEQLRQDMAAGNLTLASDTSIKQLQDRLATIKTFNSKAVNSKDFKNDFATLENKIGNLGNGQDTKAYVNDLNNQLTDLKTRFNDAGKTGMSFFDTWKQRMGSLGAYLASFASFYRIIRVIKQTIQVVREFDTALTEMRKVSDESMQSLQNFQKASFDMADGIGSNALQVQKSTADFLRLGESFNEAQHSAMTANVLMNVSEFDNIDEATESLISMSAAYDDLDKMDIVDKLNLVGL